MLHLKRLERLRITKFLVGALAGLVTASAVQAAPERPNIVVFFIDDMATLLHLAQL